MCIHDVCGLDKRVGALVFASQDVVFSFASFAPQAILPSLLLDHRAMYILVFLWCSPTHPEDKPYGVIPEAAHTTRYVIGLILAIISA